MQKQFLINNINSIIIINFNFRYYETMKDPVTKNILIIGSMQEPVTWEFKVTLQLEDIDSKVNNAYDQVMNNHARRLNVS